MLPMNYSVDFSKPHNIQPFQFVMELEGLSTYQQQLRLSCLLKLREYSKGE